MLLRLSVLASVTDNIPLEYLSSVPLLSVPSFVYKRDYKVIWLPLYFLTPVWWQDTALTSLYCFSAKLTIAS